MNNQQVDAYVLHTRAYGESSLLVDLFSLQMGRVSAIARGARTPKNRSILQPFNRLSILLAGKKELKSLRSYEVSGECFALSGEQLLLGLYVNELLSRLLQKFDVMITLFYNYGRLLQQLVEGDIDAEIVLRLFEFNLLSDLGYGISFTRDVQINEPIRSDAFYTYSAGRGFSQVSRSGERHISGCHILAAAEGDFQATATRRLIKKVARIALGELLGERPLNSRQLFSGVTRG